MFENSSSSLLRVFVLLYTCFLIECGENSPSSQTPLKQPEKPNLPDWIEKGFCQGRFPSQELHAPKGYHLKQVQVIARHGDRAPEVWFPIENVEWHDCHQINHFQTIVGKRIEESGPKVQVKCQLPLSNPYSDLIWRGSCSPGDLTSKGFKMAHDLGVRLRKRYKLLNLEPKHVMIRSVFLARCIDSAQSMLSGLFQNDDSTIKVHADSYPIDSLFPNDVMCPRLGRLNVEVKQSQEWLDHLANLAPLRQVLDYVTGMDKQDKIILPGSFSNDSLADYVESIAARVCHGKDLPCREGECLTREQASHLFEAGNWEYKTKYDPPGNYTQEKLRLASANLIREMLSHIYHGNNHKFVYYSVRRNTFGPLLHILQDKPIGWPPFLSNLVMEIWQKQSHLAVRFVWNSETLVLPFCEDPCPLPKLLERFSSFTFPHGREILSACK